MIEDTNRSASTTTWVVRPDPDLEDLIPSFMGNRRTDLNDIRDAIARKDFEFIRRTAHTLKGICRPYGFEYLETLSKELEGAGEREDIAAVQSVSERMQDYLDNVRIVYDS
jgi:HPt (histidine-containing phosphotransfer) domain-containing protein